MNDKVEALSQIFPMMVAEDLAQLADLAKLHSYPPDTILCQEGQVENTFYAIVSGQVEVSKQLDEATEQVINRPGPGSFVGEIALVQEGPRTATVRTVEPTTVLEIEREDFIRMLHSSAPMAVRVMLQITPRLRDIDLTTIAHLRQQNAELTQAYEDLKQRCQALEAK
ncbi:MAG TPA: cyclic nucleotide-binding domain-containing protein [Chloroflexi bacterium]|nr:cyclic nucleotide-binding domain-containing protein [Chloroflexota bacterium]